jgi:hypothetical protein
MAYKGVFQPINPRKYRGDVKNIIYRSRWEQRFMSFLDRDKDVLEWSSEEFFIVYRCKTDGKVHRYFPDFKIKIKTKTGAIKTKVIEIKPHGQTFRPVKPQKVTRRYLNEAYTYMKNRSKWEAAKEWCANRGYEFEIITEKHLPGVFDLNR